MTMLGRWRRHPVGRGCAGLVADAALYGALMLAVIVLLGHLTALAL